MKNIMNTSKVIGAISLLLFHVCAHAEERVVTLGHNVYQLFQLLPASPVETVSFNINGETSLVIDVASKSTSVDVQLLDPQGNPYNAQAWVRGYIAEADVTPLAAVVAEAGEHASIEVPAPQSGTWSLVLSLPPGATESYGNVTVVRSGGLAVSAFTSRSVYGSDVPAVIGLAAFHGQAPVTGATVTAALYKDSLDGTPTNIMLLDDGVPPDSMSGDGLYTAMAENLTPGHYLVQATVLSGGSESVSATDFTVIAPLASFSEGITDEGVDSNGDGLFESIRIILPVDVTTPGAYEVIGKLSKQDMEARAAVRIEAQAGAQNIFLDFPASEVKEFLGQDGPYQLDEFQLIKVSDPGTTQFILADRVAELGETAAYTLGQLQRPVLVIVPGISDTASDTDADGLYDWLTVNFTANTLRAGYYIWSGSLQAADRTQLDVASGRGYLSVGDNSLTVNFEGEKIGKAGLNGGYVLRDVAVYGPANVVALTDEVGTTSDYSYSEFEGSETSFERLILELNELPITGPGGKPQSDNIRQSLLAKAENASGLYDKGQAKAAKNILAALANEVEAIVGVRLRPADGTDILQLISELSARL